MLPDNIFAGKVVSVYVPEPAQGGTFENVRMEKVEGRDFIVGTLAPLPSHPDSRVGISYWIALDSVQMFAIFPDLETAQSRYGKNFELRQLADKPRRHWWNR